MDLKFVRYMVYRWDQHSDRIYYSRDTGEPISLYKALREPDHHCYKTADAAIDARRELNKGITNTKSLARFRVGKIVVMAYVHAYERINFPKYKRVKHAPDKEGGWIKGPGRKPGKRKPKVVEGETDAETAEGQER